MQKITNPNDRSIERNEVEDVWALTPMQEGMLFHYIHSPGKGLYFEQLDLSLTGEIIPGVFETAWNDVIANNPMLRAVFRWHNTKQPIQLILKKHQVQFSYFDLRNQPKPLQYEEVEKIKKNDRAQDFDLQKVPFRIILCQLGERNGCMIVSSHHILFDGWSNGIILKEFFMAFQERLGGKVPVLPVKTLFKHFIRWKQSALEPEAENYWQLYLQGYDRPALLPIKNTNTAIEEPDPGSSPQRQRLLFPLETRERANEWAKTHEVTLAALLYSTWGILLQRYTDSDDVVFGTTVSGRSAPVPGIEGMVGLLIETLPLRVQEQDNETVEKRVQRINGVLREREGFRPASLVNLKAFAGIPAEQDFFDSLVVIENYPLDEDLSKNRDKNALSLPLSLDSYRMVEKTDLDLTVGIMLFDTIDIHFLYPAGRFDDEIIQRLSFHFYRIFQAILDDDEVQVNDIELVSREEKKEIVEQFNGTDQRDMGSMEKTLHELFINQAIRTPGQQALVFDRARYFKPGDDGRVYVNEGLTYEDLLKESALLVYILKKKGVAPGSIIGIMMERSIEMVMGIMGILMARCTYLPIDPGYPAERAAYLLKDSGAKLLVIKDETDSCHTSSLKNETMRRWGGEIISIHDNRTKGQEVDIPGLLERLWNQHEPGSAAYIIYTSGSTGKPKGVVVEHRSAVNLLLALQRLYPLGDRDTFLLKTPYLFDVSVSELFGWTMGGGRLALLPAGAEKEPQEIIHAIDGFKVTHINFVPSLFYAFVDHLYLYQDKGEDNGDLIKSLKYIFLAGEALLGEPVQRFRQLLTSVQPQPQIENLYGPTEATVYASGFSLARWEKGNIPIGKPLDNMKLFIVSGHGQLQPVGVPGELIIAGAGVARGYLNRPDLTNEKFITLPSLSSFIGGKVYKTGDLSRWLGDGNIEYLGRMDRQVKIRGFRIELGEIENLLVGHDGVKEAVVIAGEYGDGDRFLCAYIVLREGQAKGSERVIEELKTYLGASLPGYMVPAFFVELEHIPLTGSGKVDRNALPQPGTGTVKEIVWPRDETEKKLAETWREVLGLDENRAISIDDHFFSLGGHSLKAAGLVGRIHKIFDIHVPLDELFKRPTIRSLRQFLATAHKERYTLVEAAEKKEYYGLSYPQQRLFVLYQTGQASLVYNMPAILELHGRFDGGRCGKVFNELIERHESLRTSFLVIDEGPVQVIHERESVVLTIEDLGAINGDREAIDRAIHGFIRPFDLGIPPLIRVGMLSLGDEKNLLLVDMHHIISDGTSVGILTGEFISLYKGDRLGGLELQYKDYSCWLHHAETVARIEKQEKYWLERLGDSLPVLELPLDNRRRATEGFAGVTRYTTIEEETTTKLKNLAIQNHTTLYNVLLTCFYTWLAKLSGQEDIIVGTVAEGRGLLQWQGMIGFFINTMAIRHFPVGNKTVGNFLEEINRETLLAFENQEYPFERLVEKLGIHRDKGKNPVFDVLFTLQNMDVPELTIPGLRLKPYPFDPGVSKFDLSLIATEQGKEIALALEYRVDLFGPATIERLVSYFLRLVAGMPGLVDEKISEIDMLGEEEKQQLLEDFNRTGREYPKTATIGGLFVEAARKHRDSVALVSGENNLETMTYHCLDELSGRLSRLLTAKGVKGPGIVAIMLERSLGVGVGLLGILKTGAAYLPIEPNYPPERITYMLADSNARALVTTESLLDKMARGDHWKGDIIILSKMLSAFSTLSEASIFPGYSASSSIFTGANGDTSRLEARRDLLSVTSARIRGQGGPAYVIYTSGSTGRAKGVMVEHEGVVRLVKNTNYIDFKKGEHVLQTGALAFDASTFEIWGALLNGLELYLLKNDDLLNPAKLKRAIRCYDIGILWMTSALFNEMSDADIEIFATLRHLLVGGDVLSVHHIERVRSRFSQLKIINGYGPTENTTFSTTFAIEGECKSKLGREFQTSIPIGRPIANSTAYIVDRYNHLVAIGVGGELWVGGAGVARGYLNRPELTGEKFIEMPGQGVVYKTGDLVRWLADGNIEFIGRMDQQVKIRGYRIEPAEIESGLLSFPGIKEAVVVPLTDGDGQRFLCAYIVASVKSSGVEVHTEVQTFIEGLKQMLGRVLPVYMVPDRWMLLERIPLTANGKVDRQALPFPGVSESGASVAPRDEIEKKLAELWGDVLGIDPAAAVIGIDDDFFQLGGHSLKAVNLVSRIHKILSIQVPLAELFNRPTIRQLRAYLTSQDKSKYTLVEPTEKQEHYPLSFAQKRLYILYRSDPGSVVYNIPAIMELHGELSMERCQEVFNRLVERHESLRTSIHQVDEEPFQVIHDRGSVQVNVELIKYNEYAGHHDLDSDDKTCLAIIQGFVRAFDLRVAPLLRVGIAELQENDFLFMVDMHHIISDGTSMGILIKEWMALYQGETLEELILQYKDYTLWQYEPATGEEMARQEAYWLQSLSGSLPRLEMPLDMPRPLVHSFAGESLHLEIDEASTQRLIHAAQQQGMTLFMILMALFYTWLSKLSGQEDIIVGTVTQGRRLIHWQNLVGFFINTLALRHFPEGNKRVQQFFNEIKTATPMAFENQEYAFDQLVEKLGATGERNRNPVFDVLFTLQNMDIPKLEIPGMCLKPFSYNPPIAKFDLSLTAIEGDGKLDLTFEYNTALFYADTITRFISYFQRLISHIPVNQDLKIAGLDILSAEEKRELLEDLNQTGVNYPATKSIHDLFMEQVQKTPDRVAVVSDTDGVETYTYENLNEQAQQLALELLNRGIASGSIIATILDRSIYVAVGLLGILKAGSAYLPVEPGYPAERIEYILRDSNAQGVVTSSELLEKNGFIDSWPGVKIVLPLTGLLPFPAPQVRGSLAYVIYTSGSTGKPKGVMVDHYSVVRLVKNTNYIEFQEGERMLQVGALTFDVSTFELWGALLNGLELYLIEKDKIMVPAKLKQAIQRYDIGMFFMTAALFTQMSEEDVDMFATVRYLLAGGDVLSPPHVERVRSRFPHLKIINGYGPTENTTFSTTFLINREYKTSIPIGYPIANSTAYVVDKYGCLVPIGVSGELWVGGDGVARGYLNRPGLTAEKFVSAYPLGRIYKTGDRVHWNRDRELIFSGRIDQQVKIRGFRIEPGEIEHRLAQMANVKEVAVVPREEKNQQRYLCAYIVPVDMDSILALGLDASSWVEELKRGLKEVLPAYMIPDRWMTLERLPLTPNGKVDRRALPEPSLRTGKTITAPRNDIEKQMVDIWAKILTIGGESISIDDDFFQLGGHSLKATILASRVHSTFAVPLTLAQIFQSPTVAGMAALVAGAVHSGVRSIVPVETREYYPLSSTQNRFYMLQMMEPAGVAYNMLSARIIEGELEKEKLERAFQCLIERHESFRTSFLMVAGTPVQRIHAHVDFHIREFGQIAAGAETKIIENFVKPFDLSQAPLLRLGLGELAESKYFFLFDMHHIIFDGMSLRVLLDELALLLTGGELPPLSLQYKDFAVWQEEQLVGGGFKAQEDYWLEVFSGSLPVLNIPLDFPRPPVQDFRGAHIDFVIEGDLLQQVRQLQQERGLTLYMVLLGAFNILLSVYSGQDDLIVGTPVSGRYHADLEPLIGVLIETLALRSFPEPGIFLTDFLESVKRAALDGFKNQAYPFRELIKRVGDENDISRNPLFDVMINVLNADMQALDIEGLRLIPYPFAVEVAKVDLTLTAYEEKARVQCQVEYATSLFKKETMARLAIHFVHTLGQLTQNANNRGFHLYEIEVMDEKEKRQIVEVFNGVVEELEYFQPVQQLIEQQGQGNPGSIALVEPGDSDAKVGLSLTYTELNRRAECLAVCLQERGVTRDTIVAIMLERSVEMIIGLLGILKAGGAYLPVDAEYPVERIEYMLADSGTRLLVTAGRGAGRLNQLTGWQGETVDLEELFSRPGNRESEKKALVRVFDRGWLAYVIYTSGSTGRPKGVLVEHGNIAAYLEAFQRQFGFTSRDIVVQQASYSFDTFGEEVYPVLLAGGKLVVPSLEAIRDIPRLWRVIEQYGVTVLDCSPLLLSQLNQYARRLSRGSGIKLYISGGDALKGEHIDLLLTQASIYNTYGPTESTICATFYRCTIQSGQETGIAIGRPFIHYAVYIFSLYYRVQPIGVPGELCVAGAGVTRGYLNRPGLTAERFVTIELEQKPGRVLVYKTGDRARWGESGVIEYLGRVDTQVKIRGYRIEPGEIERHLLAIAGIKQAVVLGQQGKEGDVFLCAYFVPEENQRGRFSVVQLREILGRRLPVYMIPSYFIEIETVPMTTSGKLDQKKLPHVTGSIGVGSEFVPPGTPVEMRLVELWSRHLHKPLERIGILDNFFDLGGQSIIAMRMAAELREVFQVEIPLITFFQQGTVQALARTIERLQAQKVSMDTVASNGEDHTLSRLKVKKRERVKVEL